MPPSIEEEEAKKAAVLAQSQSPAAPTPKALPAAAPAPSSTTATSPAPAQPQPQAQIAATPSQQPPSAPSPAPDLGPTKTNVGSSSPSPTAAAAPPPAQTPPQQPQAAPAATSAPGTAPQPPSAPAAQPPVASATLQPQVQPYEQALKAPASLLPQVSPEPAEVPRSLAPQLQRPPSGVSLQPEFGKAGAREMPVPPYARAGSLAGSAFALGEPQARPPEGDGDDAANKSLGLGDDAMDMRSITQTPFAWHEDQAASAHPIPDYTTQPAEEEAGAANKGGAAQQPAAPEKGRQDPVQRSVQDVVKTGRERGLSPAEIAREVVNHRNTLETEGRKKGGAQYFDEARRADITTEDALDELWEEEKKARLQAALPDPQDRQKMISQLEAGGKDPDALDEKLRPLAKSLMERPKELTVPVERYYGGKINAGGRDLAHYSMRKANDGMMDVSLTIPDPEDPNKETKEMIRVPHATQEDVQAEIAKLRVEQEKAQKGQDFYAWLSARNPETKVYARNVARNADEVAKWKQQIATLEQGGPQYLMGERVREELKKPEWRGKVGEYAGGTELYKGLESAAIMSGGLVTRLGQVAGVDGADEKMRQLMELQETQDLRLGGSTRRALEGGLWNDTVTGTQRGVGHMAPYVAG